MAAGGTISNLILSSVHLIIPDSSSLAVEQLGICEVSNCPTSPISGGGRKRRGLGPRNDVRTTCKADNPRASQRPSKAPVCFLMISTLALSVE